MLTSYVKGRLYKLNLADLQPDVISPLIPVQCWRFRSLPLAPVL